MSVGVAELDTHHKRLFTMLEELLSISEAGRDQALLEETLQRFIDYTKHHFAREEELLEGHRYPDTKEHRGEHRRLIEDVEWFQRNFNGDASRTLCNNSLQFLGRWVTDHILDSDLKYRSFVSSPDLL